MRVLIISDTHGSRVGFDRVVEREGSFDLMLHMGDMECDQDYFEAVLGCPCYFVCGNNDWGADEPYDRVVGVGRHKIFMTHGHGYGLYFGYKELIRQAKQNGCDTIIHGHTHKPLDKYEEGVRILNPGSLTFPRQTGRQPSYIVAEVDAAGDLTYEQRFL